MAFKDGIEWMGLDGLERDRMDGIKWMVLDGIDRINSVDIEDGIDRMDGMDGMDRYRQR